MVFEIVLCPHCDQKTKIPLHLIGKRVECPICHEHFIAPDLEEIFKEQSPDHEDSEGGIKSNRTDGHPDREFGSRMDPRSRSRISQPRVQAPKTIGIFLIIVGLLGALLNSYQLFLCIMNPDEVVASQQEVMDALLKDQNKPILNADEIIRLQTASSIICLFFSTMTVLAGIAMIGTFWYPVAVTGCLLAMINFHDCCCLLGLPIGIVGLVKLFNEDVKALFYKSRRSNFYSNEEEY